MAYSYRNFEIKDIIYRRAIRKLASFLKKHFYLIISTLATINFIYYNIDSWNYQFLDADGYMRAIRIKNWLTNPSFFEQKILETNYPFGEINHWTRPLDILWLISSLPFFFLKDIKDILFLGGSFMSPLFGILASIVLGYGLKRQFNIFIALTGVIFFLFFPQTSTIFAFSRPDHHSFLALLSIYSFSNILCWLKKRQHRYLLRLSFSLSLMTFSAIEGFIISAIFIFYFIYLYIFKNISLIPTYKILKNYTLFLIIFLLLNPPFEGYLYPDNGRLSILYITIISLITFGIYILQRQKLHTPILKITSLITTLSITFLITILLFSKTILDTPLPEEISTIWAKHITEMYPAHKLPFYFQSANYIFPSLSLLLNLYLLITKHHRRILILNLIIGIPLFILSLIALRFSPYQLTYIFTPYLCLIDIIYKKSDYYLEHEGEFPTPIYIIIFFVLFLQQLIMFPVCFSTPKQPITIYTSHLCQNIKNVGGTLVTDTFLSPQYIYNCNVNSVSSPYHRNIEGIIDGHNILFSDNDTTLIPLLLKHQVTQILMFDNYSYQYNLDEKNKNKLYYRLIKNENVPYYLEKITTYNPNIHHYKLTTI